MRWFFSFLSFAVLILPAHATAQLRKDMFVGEEYAVYSAVIAEQYIKEGVRLVVATTPTCCEVTDKMKDDVLIRFTEIARAAVSPSQETLDSYALRNKTRVALRKSFKLNVKYQIVPEKRLQRLFDMIELEEDWKTFYRRYPRSNGYMTLSRVGFNRTGDEAFLSTGWMCGSLCGEGRYIVLRKKNGRWKIEAVVGTWVS